MAGFVVSRPVLKKTGGALIGLAALAGAALAVPGTAVASGSSATYYKAVSTCAIPRAGQMGCYAMRRVAVSSRTPGATLATALPRSIAVGPAGGFTPGDLAKAYGQNPKASVNQTVGIVDAYNDPNALADLKTFDAQYGLPAETSTSFRQVGQTGSAASLPANDTTGWSTEESLDLDAVRGMCNTCKIILVEANSATSDDLGAAVDEAVALGATEVTNSYGGAEDGTLTSAQIADYNHPGVVITASTADNGYFDWDYANYGYASSAPPAGTPTASSNAPSFPASSKTVTAVGGTTLQLNDNGTRSGESVWNENGTFDNTGYYAAAPQGASGGGCSTQFTAQKWQSSVAGYSATACGKMRLAGDISALADPNTGFDIYDSYAYTSGARTGWATYGGTSLSSPLIAAMWALAGGSGGVKYPSLSLYGHEKSTKGSTYDVTVGGNGYCDGTSTGECGSIFAGGSPNTIGAGVLDCAWTGETDDLAVGTRACDAATGYDGPSGVGTPNGTAVFKAMNPKAVITTPGTITHGKSATYSAKASTDPFPGGSITKYSWGFGDHTTSTSAAPAHKYAKAGKYTITLTVTDSYGRSATSTKVVTAK